MSTRLIELHADTASVPCRHCHALTGEPCMNLLTGAMPAIPHPCRLVDNRANMVAMAEHEHGAESGGAEGDADEWTRYSDTSFRDMTLATYLVEIIPMLRADALAPQLVREIEAYLKAEAECGDDRCGGVGGLVSDLDQLDDE